MDSNIGEHLVDDAIRNGRRLHVGEALACVFGKLLDHLDVLVAEILRRLLQRVDLAVDGRLLGERLADELACLSLGLAVDALALEARFFLELIGAALSGDECLRNRIVELVLLGKLFLQGLDLLLCGLRAGLGLAHTAFGLFGLHERVGHLGVGLLELGHCLVCAELGVLELFGGRHRGFLQSGELVVLDDELLLQFGDLAIHRIDFGGNAVDEDIDLLDVVAANLMFEALFLYFLRRNTHEQILSLQEKCY